MSDPSQTPPPSPESPSPTRSSMAYGLPLGGVIILAVGVVFLLRNFGFHLPGHWWAVIIMIPAVASLVTAIRFYRQDGKATARVTGAATGGAVMLAIGLALYFGVNWSLFWPVILIVVGLGIIARGAWRQS